MKMLESLPLKDESEVNIFDEIMRERARQDAKFGVQNHSPVIWITILGEEFGEASKEALEMRFRDIYPTQSLIERMMKYRNEVVQCAAVCVAMIQCIDRGDWLDEFFSRPEVLKIQKEMKHE